MIYFPYSNKNVNKSNFKPLNNTSTQVVCQRTIQFVLRSVLCRKSVSWHWEVFCSFLMQGVKVEQLALSQQDTKASDFGQRKPYNYQQVCIWSRSRIFLSCLLFCELQMVQFSLRLSNVQLCDWGRPFRAKSAALTLTSETWKKINQLADCLLRIIRIRWKKLLNWGSLNLLLLDSILPAVDSSEEKSHFGESKIIDCKKLQISWERCWKTETLVWCWVTKQFTRFHLFENILRFKLF